MLIHGKGWGWAVFFVPLALLPVVFGVLIGFRRAAILAMDPDKVLHQVLGVWLLLSALCVYAIDRYRTVVARQRQGNRGGPFVKDPVRDDSFLFLAMFAWPYVLGALGLGVLAYSWWL